MLLLASGATVWASDSLRPSHQTIPTVTPIGFVGTPVPLPSGLAPGNPTGTNAASSVPFSPLAVLVIIGVAGSVVVIFGVGGTQMVVWLKGLFKR